MLTRSSRTVLKVFRKKGFKFQNIEQLCKTICNMSESELEEELTQLHEFGLIRCRFADSTIYDAELTYEGKHYGEIKWLRLKAFLLESIAVPIFVSAITAIITMLICNLLE